MRILATDTRTLPALAAARPERLGFLLTPRGGHDPAWAAATFGDAWACDNDAFSGFDETRYRTMLDRVAACGVRPAWVTAPDVVADAGRTLDLFGRWAHVIAGYGLPVALVAQDGLRWWQVPWAAIRCLFVGGSTAWKLGPLAAELVRAARAWGKWVHMGRCSTRQRMERAYRLGCDSVDGSIFSRQPRKWLPTGLRWLARMHAQPAFRW
jgi:hypothetical protein